MLARCLKRNVCANRQVDDLSQVGVRVRHVEGFKVITAGQLVGNPGNARRGARRETILP